MTERQTLALYLTIVAVAIGVTVARYFGYIAPPSLDAWDIIASVGWAFVPLFMCRVMFCVARFFKRLADKMEAQTWQIRTETKQYRRNCSR